MEKRINTENIFSKSVDYVPDRPGHDFRYSINSEKIQTKINWKPKYSLKQGLENTINWYIDNKDWLENVKIKSNYNGERIGLLN